MGKTPALFALFVASVFAAPGLGPGSGEERAPVQSPERFARARAMILEAVQRNGVPSISIAAASSNWPPEDWDEWSARIAGGPDCDARCE